ncbi:MAG: hypothetical protein AUJ12_00900 [Alphaproteobacteria bacterium CG1_02_46_17]|nr:MAG: hypothetical protein AUJ12_00900 [Alphaproteobacteria bacterium CG1_02_46_17]
MNRSSLRTFLLLTTCLTLVACDDQNETKSDPQANVQKNGTSVIGYYMPQIKPIQKTLSGSFLAGEHAQLSNDWSAASDYFEDILADDPQDTSIQNRVMALSLGSGNYDRAIKLSKQITQERKNESLAQLVFALDEFKAEKYKEAEARIIQIKQDGLGSAIMPLILAWCEAGQGKTNLETLKNSPSFLYQSVLIADYTGNQDAVKTLAKTYDFTKTPTPISGLENIADVFAKYGETEEARSIYTALRNALPDNSHGLGEKIKKLSNKEKIVTPQITPQEGLAHALLDTARLLANGYEESAILFTHMSRFLDPRRADTLELLAQFSADHKQYKDAISYLTKIDPKDNKEESISLKRQIAMLLEMDNQKDEAIRVLQDLVEKDRNIDAQIQIGDIYRQDENFKAALSAYNQAAQMMDNKIPQDHWQLLFSRGITNERLSNWDQAEKDLTDALSYEPDQPYVLNYLGYTWADQGRNLDKAVEMIEKASRLKPDDGAIIDSLGWVYYRMGNFSTAVKKLETAIELQPYESEINDHLGDAYWQVGRKNEARFQWKRAISFTKDQIIIDKIQAKIENGLSISDVTKTAIAVEPNEKLVDNK